MIDLDILSRIKDLQKARGWSNYALAKKAGLHENSINNLFRLNNQPTFSTVEAICSAFEITLSQFFAEANDPISLTDEQLELLKIWDTLNHEQKGALLELLKKL